MVSLPLFGRDRTIQGGPFDLFAPPGIGVCLHTGSARAGQATVVIDIPDFQAPTEAQFVDGLVAILRAMDAAPDLSVYIGCRAGLGRTGTVIAGLAKLAGIADPVGWTRVRYDASAVETSVQLAAVAALDVRAVWAAYSAAPGDAS